MLKEPVKKLPHKSYEEFIQLLHDKREYLPCISVGKVESITNDHLQDTIVISSPLGATKLQLQIVLHSVALSENAVNKDHLVGQYIVFSYVSVYNQLQVHGFFPTMPEQITNTMVSNYLFSIEEENISMPEESFNFWRRVLGPFKTILANAMTARRGHKPLEPSKEPMPAAQ